MNIKTSPLNHDIYVVACRDVRKDNICNPGEERVENVYIGITWESSDGVVVRYVRYTDSRGEVKLTNAPTGDYIFYMPPDQYRSLTDDGTRTEPQYVHMPVPDAVYLPTIFCYGSTCMTYYMSLIFMLPIMFMFFGDIHALLNIKRSVDITRKVRSILMAWNTFVYRVWKILPLPIRRKSYLQRKH